MTSKNEEEGIVMVVSVDDRNFPHCRAFWRTRNHRNNYSMIFELNPKDSLVPYLRAFPRGSVCLFDRQRETVHLLKGLFTELVLTEEQRENTTLYSLNGKDQLGNLYFEFHTMTIEDSRIN